MTPAAPSSVRERAVWLLPVLLVAVVVRVALLWSYERSDLAACLGMDPSYFYTSAIRIYHGELTQGHGLFVGGPLYPYFLAMLMHLVGVDYLRLRLIQGVIGVATALLTAWLGGRLYSRRVGVVAGVASSLCGPLVLGELGFENEFLVTFFTVAALALLAACRRSRGGIFGAGLLLGLAALTRGNQLFAVGLTFLWLLATAREWRSGIVDSVLLFAGVCLAIAPVTVRNYLQYHEFIAISAHGGYVFYLGNNPQAIYRYQALSFGDASTEGEFPAAWNEANRRTGMRLSPGEASSYWFREGLRFVASEPGRFLANDVDKVVAFFNRYEIPDNYNYDFVRAKVAFLPVLALGFGVILPLAAMGLFTVRSRERALLLVVPATSLLTAVIFYYNGRFRVTALPFLLILAVAGLFLLLELVRERRHRQVAALAGTGAAVAVVAFLPPKIADDYYFSYVTTGECLEKSAPKQAIDYYRRAIELHPRVPGAHVNLGRLHFAGGDFASARREFMAVPDSPQALIELSVIAFSQENYPEAIACLEKALAIQPNLLSAYNRLSLLYSLVGREADARAVMNRALAIDPAYFKEFSNVGQ